MKNILVPFDFSKAAVNALEYAIKFADNDVNLTIYLLHILNGDEDKKKTVAKLKEAISKYNRPEAPYLKSIIREGDLSQTIIDLREELEAELIIMGTGGAPDPKCENIATCTSDFVQRADLPVLVIPESTTNFKIENIVLTVGKEKIIDTAPLHLLLDVSKKFNAKVQVLTVHKHEKDLGYTQDDQANESILQYYLESSYSQHAFVENEDITEGINEYIIKREMDMLAIMPNTHLKNGDSSKGRLTKLLTLYADIPLLILD